MYLQNGNELSLAMPQKYCSGLVMALDLSDGL
jgi:hypothetical protein